MNPRNSEKDTRDLGGGSIRILAILQKPVGEAEDNLGLGIEGEKMQSGEKRSEYKGKIFAAMPFAVLHVALGRAPYPALF